METHLLTVSIILVLLQEAIYDVIQGVEMSPAQPHQAPPPPHTTPPTTIPIKPAKTTVQVHPLNNKYLLLYTSKHATRCSLVYDMCVTVYLVY